MHPLALLTEELKSDEVETRIKAMRRLRTVAQALGPDRTRSELVPFLQGTLVLWHHVDREDTDTDRSHRTTVAAVRAFVQKRPTMKMKCWSRWPRNSVDSWT